jgi:hypothetical protein
MKDIPSKARRLNSIRAIFEDGTSNFLLPSDATLEELAVRLAHLTEQHQSKPIGLRVKLASLSD